MRTVLVCGGRQYANSARMNEVLDQLHAEEPIGRIVHGAAPGADTLAGEWAESRGVVVAEYPADWAMHVKQAGPIRNGLMLAREKPDLVVAFPGGRGTRNMVTQAKTAHVQVIMIDGGPA